MQHIFEYGLNDLDEIVKRLKPLFDRANVVTLEGPLGAGKTTLVREIMQASGVKDDVTSPTFTYVNTYTTADGRTIYHFDLYRLNSLDDFYAAGFDEYLYAPNSLCIIEWPEIVMPLLNENLCKITLEHVDANTRKMFVECLSEYATE
jgi:tRNA threonylcarbamoyladenosine biosynthesis protein TsaE